MNKRAKMRIIGVVAIIILIGVAIYFGVVKGDTNIASSSTVEDVAKDTKSDGKQVKVEGTVVAGSYDPTKTPMEFDIRDNDDADESGDTVHIIYDGQIPSTFGDGVIAIVTGKAQSGTVTASEMITKCPSKYESAEGALTPKTLRQQGAAMVGKTTKIAGAVTDGSIKPVGEEYRFIIHSEGDEMKIRYSGALPEGIKDGSSVIVTGSLGSDDVFDATDVALDKNIKQ